MDMNGAKILESFEMEFARNFKSAKWINNGEIGLEYV